MHPSTPDFSVVYNHLDLMLDQLDITIAAKHIIVHIFVTTVQPGSILVKQNFWL